MENNEEIIRTKIKALRDKIDEETLKNASAKELAKYLVEVNKLEAMMKAIASKEV